MATVLKTINLKKEYKAKGVKTCALSGVDLSIEEGEFVGVMGPSGAGKSTFLNLISTVDKPTSGQVIFRDKDLSELKGKKLAQFRRDHIGFLFQDFNLLSNLNVMDNIALPLALSGVHPKKIKDNMNKLISFFGLTEHIHKYPYQLSGGQKQRVAAARALITKPSIILADEPTGALDSKSAAELLGCLSDINEKYQSTIVMVTHDPMTASYCNRIVFIKDGKVYAKLNKDGARKDFYKKILDLLATIGGAGHEFH